MVRRAKFIIIKKEKFKGLGKDLNIKAGEKEEQGITVKLHNLLIRWLKVY